MYIIHYTSNPPAYNEQLSVGFIGKKRYFQLMMSWISYEVLLLGYQYIRVAPVDLWPQIKGSLYIIIKIPSDIVADVNT